MGRPVKMAARYFSFFLFSFLFFFWGGVGGGGKIITLSKCVLSKIIGAIIFNFLPFC